MIKISVHLSVHLRTVHMLMFFNVTVIKLIWSISQIWVILGERSDHH